MLLLNRGLREPSGGGSEEEEEELQPGPPGPRSARSGAPPSTCCAQVLRAAGLASPDAPPVSLSQERSQIPRTLAFALRGGKQSP